MSLCPQKWKKKKYGFQKSYKHNGSKFEEEKEDGTILGLSQEPQPNQSQSKKIINGLLRVMSAALENIMQRT